MNDEQRAFFADRMRLCDKHGVEMYATMCTEISFKSNTGWRHNAYSVCSRRVFARGRNVLDRSEVEEMKEDEE